MTMLKNTLNCGFIKNRKNQPCVELMVTRLADIQNIIIPLLQKKSFTGG